MGAAPMCRAHSSNEVKLAKQMTPETSAVARDRAVADRADIAEGPDRIPRSAPHAEGRVFEEPLTSKVQSIGSSEPPSDIQAD